MKWFVACSALAEIFTAVGNKLANKLLWCATTKKASLISEFNHAYIVRDYHREDVVARLLFGRAVGPKRRQYNIPNCPRLASLEWIAYLSQLVAGRWLQAQMVSGQIFSRMTVQQSYLPPFSAVMYAVEDHQRLQASDTKATLAAGRAGISAVALKERERTSFSSFFVVKLLVTIRTGQRVLAEIFHAGATN